MPAGPAAVAVLTGMLAALGGYLGWLTVQRSASIMSLMAGLLMLDEAVLGALVLASMGFLAVVHERQRLQALDQARRDGLTGTYTRAAFFDMADRLQERCAVLMLDIDHFKHVNDRFGHRGGDLTLAHAGRLMMGAVRIDDLVGRYGGEEFCILLRGCGIAEAETFAQRLVQDARSASVRLPDGRAVTYTLSAGYAAREPDEALADAIDRADVALYRAKHRGRNRAEAAARPGLQASSA